MTQVTVYAPGLSVAVFDTPPLRWCDPTRPLIGLNCLQPFGYGISSGGAYIYSGNGPFANGGTDAVVLPDARLAKIKSTGFDFVRLCVDVAALMATPNDTVLDGLIQQLLLGIGRRVSAGLRVLVDMHVLGAGQHPVSGWSQSALVDGPNGPKMTRMKYVVARLATAMWAVRSSTCPPDRVSLELFNEPAASSAFSPAYQTQIVNYWQAVRAVCGFTLVVGGANYNALDGTPEGVSNAVSGLTALVASAFDANTAFSFHAYEPGVFVFQGVPGTLYADMHGLTFPVTDYPGGLAKAQADFTAAATAAGHLSTIAPVVTNTTWSTSLSKAFSQYGTKALLGVRLAVATAWADAAGVTRRRLFDTEGGVSFGAADTLGTAGDATPASAAAWLRARRENAEAAGIGCVCVHEMQGSNFGIQSSASPWNFNAAIQAALFS